MSNPQKALLMAAGILLTIALITIAVNLFGSASEATKSAQNEFSSMQEQLSAAAFSHYENGIQTGSQVKAAIRKYIKQEGFGILVKTGKNKTAGEAGVWYGNKIAVSGGPGSVNYGSVVSAGESNITLAEKETDNSYINPSGQFKGQLIYDNNNSIRGIIFEQK